MGDDRDEPVQEELLPRAGFALAAGDTVRYLRARGGFGFGHFERWDGSGRAVIAVPGRRTALRVAADRLRPSNDRRMVERRGWVDQTR